MTTTEISSWFSQKDDCEFWRRRIDVEDQSSRGDRMKLVGCLFVFLVSCSVSALADQDSHFAFVSEYVRQLGANEHMREVSEKEVVGAANLQDRLMAGIRGSTRIILELKSQIVVLERMQLDKDFEEVPTAIAKYYSRKIDIHEHVIETDKIFLSALAGGPKPDVDYDALANEAPQTTAMLEYIDRTLFEHATPLVFGTLIDMKPDRAGHASRLIITKAERAKLIQALTTSFGKKMEAKDQNYIVSSATVLRDYLQKKGYKCSDEPQ
jgi:hypothetical protein